MGTRLIHILAASLAALAFTAGPAGANRPHTVRAYAHRLVLQRWHSDAEWGAEDQLVRNESGWDPCAYYPSSHDCGYSGYNACGIPQRDPCGWRGDLWGTRYRQVRWLQRYIAARYGDPENALYHEEHGGY